ncbi:AMP-binding protein [Flavobacterium sp. F372]|uniref:AMP-binding protein n=1 Tax=Flavobacterium bernardetii TaxID=2813823 RepID=A0ABR7IVS1_9FLAO|nr:AMP-binding protein [Flavobacterium bernardetii]MBC5833881.1 AMP-binding protein [Flavobacterium bernardetii]NHF69114.1 AMP-binding protein [Flavobacterium bernardetii]
MNQFIHPDFKLNGKSFSYIELLSEALYLKENGQLFEKNIGKFILEWLNNESFVFVQTSGSTGKPKKIVLQKTAMMASAKATGSFFNLQPKTKALLCLSADYIAGKMMLVRAITLGLHLDTVEPNSNPLENKKYDFVAMVPMQVANSLDQLHLVETLLIGGTKVSYQMTESILKTNCQAFESYGMTETISHIAIKQIGAKPFTILPHVSISVDERNCLVIEALELSPNKISTNDIVEILNETQFILKGRIDNVINSGGVKIFPEEVEEKLAKYISTPFFVASLPDEKFGEKLVLVLEGKSFEIENAIFSELSKFQIPKEIVFVDKFMETETNKINRRKTLEKLA